MEAITRLQALGRYDPGVKFTNGIKQETDQQQDAAWDAVHQIWL